MKAEDFFARFPILETSNLLLRELDLEDVDDVFAIFSDPDVTRYYDLDVFVDRQQAEELVQRFRSRYEHGIGLRWAIAEKATPETVIGTCGYNLWVRASARAVLGFDLARSHWRRGIMTEALRHVLSFGFECMDLNRVEAVVFDRNEASSGLLQKLGFLNEGVLREYEFIKDDFVDVHMFSLLRRDPGQRRSDR